MVVGMLCIAPGLVLLAAVSGVAAAPTQCCWSPQWEGIVVEKLGVYNGINNFASIADIEDVIHVDYSKKMIVNEMSITNGSTTTVVNIIEDFNQGVSYAVVGMYCVKSNLTQAMGGNCIPESADFMSSRVVGGVSVDVWFIKGANSTARLTVSQNGCIPVQEIGLTLGQVSMLSIINVQNVTAGIANPAIFNIPASCNQSATYHHTLPFARILSMPHLVKHKSLNKIST